jgi:hypothetical protein
MATPIKHIGSIGDKKVVIAYRTLPGEPTNALVVPTAALSQTYHDELINVVESNLAQNAYELATVLATKKFSDGATMLGALHQLKHLKKVPTDSVTMQPTVKKADWVQLDKLNEIIAEQRGVGIDELALTANGEPGKTELPKQGEDVLTDEDLANQYRDQADALYKEVQDLRKKADELAPKKTSAKKTTAKANA